MYCPCWETAGRRSSWTCFSHSCDLYNEAWIPILLILSVPYPGRICGKRRGALTVVRKIEQGKENLNVDKVNQVLRMFGSVLVPVSSKELGTQGLE